ALPAPPAISLTPEEEATLSRHEIVIRTDLSDETGGTVLGVVEVAAPPDKTMAAILDLRSRVGEITGIKGLEEHGRGENWVGARWEVKVLTSSLVFHVRYEVDREKGLVVYALDPTQSPNEIVRAEGSYQLIPTGSGTRIVYRSTSDSGRSLPGWLKRWVATE